LGKFESLSEAHRRKNYLIHLGFTENNVIIHPDNCPNSIAAYGVKCVGSFIGTDEFIRAKLDKKFVKLSSIKDAILKIPNKQIIHQILRLSFSGVMNHLFRTILYSLISDYVLRYDNLKNRFSPTLLVQLSQTRRGARHVENLKMLDLDI